jgi:hypothetical protein
MGKGDPRHVPPPTPRQRFFDKEFKLLDKVAVYRADGGWYDGRVSGTITKINPMWCQVTDDEDKSITYLINHPRDIYKI